VPGVPGTQVVEAVLKAVFAIKSKYQFSYVSSIVKHLNESGCKVDLLFEMALSEIKPSIALDEFLKHTNDTTSGWIDKRSDKWRRWIFPLREVLTYADYNRREGQSPYYAYRWGRKWIKRAVPFKSVISNNIIYQWLSKIERCVPPDKRITQELIERSPDVVIASPMNYVRCEEVEYVKAAKAMGIPTVAVAISWDNLTTKGLFHVKPDLLLVWNEAHKKEAIEIHRIPKDNIGVTGAPFFDNRLEEQEICKPIIDKPYVLYLGSSYNIINDETDFVKKTQKEYGLPMVVRPHPNNTRKLNHMGCENFLVMPAILPETKRQLSELYSVIHHCEFAVGVNTSSMIDVIIQDKPCIAAKGDDLKQRKVIHFQYMLPALGKNGDRKKFVKDFIRPYGNIAAGRVAAERIRELCDQNFS
jgi:hypothetical protein